MRRLIKGLTCAALLLGTAAAMPPTPAARADADGGAPAIPRPLPGAPGVPWFPILGTDRWHPIRGTGPWNPTRETGPWNPTREAGPWVSTKEGNSGTSAKEAGSESSAKEAGSKRSAKSGDSWTSVKGVSRVLLLTIAHGESPTPTDRVALLQCSPPGGTHSKAADACKQLERVSANLNDLNVSPDARCTKEYDPVTVYGAGLWDSGRLSYERTFGNRCELRATTGAVFGF
ncbi:SSI family serine proteinase inhibitor [Sphaerisporangium perillae]|uniref:SSI family serine proteinase inhibitor n=1 Tax=Sphaerisporangium perillae TaxID=2935860 RepID=UPI00200DB711|nr:SSI family serine proteinase inhibitor [Sphaerisporangium perillae]